ncbi:phasin family protein [Rhodoferax sp. WC2427]|uniref:phasin family protein n=1 Tax=Rhodoferax sp. WC2427 TaxID=3234144 RepID=UPI003465C3F7
MTDKTRSPATSPVAPSAGLAPWNIFADWGRRQMAMAAEGTCAMLRNVEALRTLQQQVAHQALAQHEAAAEKLLKPCDPNDLLSVQSALLQSNMQNALAYWQQLGASAIKAQVDQMDGSKQLLKMPVDDPLKPVLQAWQHAIASPFNSAGYRPNAH